LNLNFLLNFDLLLRGLTFEYYPGTACASRALKFLHALQIGNRKPKLPMLRIAAAGNESWPSCD